MCGIAGGVALRPDRRPDQGIVRAMSRAIAHRGPDDEGFWVAPSGTACFAHRRLSIIDLVSGHQPFLDPEGDNGIVFNGEIYNYVELRERLETEGVRFRTESDTEVLLELLRLRGDSALDSLVGMFAFAYWDDAARRLTLVRDRVGKKPLYHTTVDGCLYFCSTLAGLEAAIASRPSIDLTSVSNFLDLGFIPAPDSIYEGVHKLAAATVMSVSQGSPAPTFRRYWDPVEADSDPISTEDAPRVLRELLEDAVRLRLRSDVPLGIFLSGGIDSSLVAALASRLSPNRVQTFTIGFNVEEFDEASRARRIAGHLGTEHHEFRVDTDVLDLLPRLVAHFGEPFADSSALPVWRLAEAARQHVTVALMGDGGDEGFAGYNWYRTAHRLGTYAALARPLKPVLRGMAAPLGAKARRAAHLLTLPASERFANLRAMFGPFTTEPPLRSEAFTTAMQSERLILNRIARYYEAHPELRPVHAMQYADLRTYLPGDLLPKVDVCTMAHGLEARAPLLDHRVLEFAFRLPPDVHEVTRPKHLLRQILGEYVPTSLTAGPKMGFSVPLSHWFRGEVRPLIDQLPSGPLAGTGWVRPPAIERLVREHQSGRRDNSMRLFHLLALDMWLSR